MMAATTLDRLHTALWLPFLNRVPPSQTCLHGTVHILYKFFHAVCLDRPPSYIRTHTHNTPALYNTTNIARYMYMQQVSYTQPVYLGL